VTLLAIKVFLKKAWSWIKNYWYIPALLFYTSIMWILFRRPSMTLLDTLLSTKKKYEEQIAIIDETHREEIKNRDKNLKNYHETISLIEEKYKKQKEDFDDEKRKRIIEIVKKHNDIESLAKEISEKLGIDYVE
jgi:uncharacterized membrane protein YhiD involved in acid resistance|tara:strand:- start:1536 stop:1937 length:402 start_codon:yes stop_codon:yes gene_type:complete